MNLKLAIGILIIAMMTVSGIAVTQDNSDNSTHTVTACLEKTSTANMCMLIGENGKMGDLRIKTTWSARGAHSHRSRHDAKSPSLTGRITGNS